MSILRHILLINHEFPPVGGGAATASAAIAKELALSGLRVTVVTSAYGELPREEEKDGYAVLRVPALRKQADSSNITEMTIFLLSSLWWVLRRGRLLGADVAIAFFGIPAGPAAWLLKKTARVPYIISLRGGDVPGFLPESLRLWHALSGGIIRFLWRHAEFVVANSMGLARLAQRAASKQKVEIIPNGAATRAFENGKDSRALDTANRSIRLISVGRLHAQKNYPCLLEAMSLVARSSWQLKIIGDGPERRSLEALAGRLGIADKITFCGWLSRSDLLRHLEDADIFAFPSIQEGMPNAVLEAMAAGLPVIACAIEGCEEIVLHGKTGFLVPPGNVAAFRDALEKLMSNEEQRKTFGKNAQNRVREEYTWNAVALKYARLCEKSASNAEYSNFF